MRHFAELMYSKNMKIRKVRSLSVPQAHEAEKDLFTQFYYDEDFKGIWEKWKDLIPLTTLYEAEIVFASGAILGKDLTAFTNKFPEPLSRIEFDKMLLMQIELEQKIPSQGIFVQPINIEKILLAAAIGIKCNKTNFIELGTYLGHNIRKLTKLFHNTYTIEASDPIYVAARKLFEFTNTPVNSFLGSSFSLLSSLDAHVGNSAVIFLDAHYSTGITSNKYGTCPLFEELTLILKKFPEAICVIDDMRTMTGLNGYPTFEDIVNFLPSSTEVVLKHDQMILNLDSGNGFSLIGDLRF
jgi:hypothetical protein